jgi:predicted hydrocarbon binding protein
MTWRKRTIMEMAREAGLRSAVLLHMYGKESALCDSEIEELGQLEAFAALVREDEREACIVDIQMHIPRSGRHTPEYQMAMRMLERIKARSTT